MPFPLLPIATAIVSEFAPDMIRHFAGDKAGDVVDKVVGVAKAVTGQDDPEVALNTLRESPELAVQLRTELAKIDAELEAAYLKDRQDARARDVSIQTQKGGNTRADFLAFAAIVGLIGLIYTLLFIDVPDGPARDVLLLLSGALVAIVKDVYQFEFGSSRGSKDKSIMLGRKAD